MNNEERGIMADVRRLCFDQLAVSANLSSPSFAVISSILDVLDRVEERLYED